MPPGEGDFLPSIDNLPARPSTMPPPPPSIPVFFPAEPTPSGQPVGATAPITPETPEPRRRGRPRRTQAEMLQGAPGMPPSPAANGAAPAATPQPTQTPPPHPDSAEAVFGGIRMHVQTESPEPSWEPELQVQESPKVHVSLGTTANIGNFENIKYDIGVSGIPIDASYEDIEAMMSQANDRAAVIMDRLGARLLERVEQVKQARGLID